MTESTRFNPKNFQALTSMTFKRLTAHDVQHPSLLQEEEMKKGGPVTWKQFAQDQPAKAKQTIAPTVFH